MHIEKMMKKSGLLAVYSFLDTSYHDDVMTKRVKYENDAICLVASEDEKIVGLIDVEIEKKPKTLCVASSHRGAVIWNLAVLPQYRRRHIALDLWKEARKKLLEKGIHYCEVWTQQDEAAIAGINHKDLKILKSIIGCVVILNLERRIIFWIINMPGRYMEWMSWS